MDRALGPTRQEIEILEMVELFGSIPRKAHFKQGDLARARLTCSQLM